MISPRPSINRSYLSERRKPAKPVLSAFALAAMMGVGAVSAHAQILAWDFTGEGTTTNSTSTADLINANLDSAATLTRGAGAGYSSGGSSFRTTGFSNNGISTSNTDFFQFTLSAASGYTLSLSTIDARFAGTSTFAASPGVSSQFAYSIDGGAFTLIGSPSVTIGTPATLPQISLTGISALQNVAATSTVTFRYYASGQTTTGGWGFNSPSSGTYGLAIGGTLNVVIVGGTAYYWVGDDSTRGGNGTWTQTGGTAWATTDADVAGTTWDSSKTATFGGAVNPSTVTVSGTVDAGAGLAFTSTGYTLSGGTINLSAASVAANMISVSTGSATIASAITGTAGMTKAGDGTLIIGGNAAYSGGSVVSAGTLQIGDGATAGSLAGNITNNATVSFNRTDDVTFAGDISGTGAVTKLGSNTLTVSGNNSYAGATTISNGVLRASSATALGNSTGATTVADGAALELTGGIAITGETVNLSGSGISSGGALRSVSGANSLSGPVNLNADSRINADADTLTLGGGVTGATRTVTFGGSGNISVTGAIATTTGGVAKDGSGTVTLSGTNTYTGTTTVNAGTLAVSGGAAIANTGAVSIANAAGATLQLNASETIGSLAGGGATGGTVNLQANTLTVGDATNTTFAGAITGTGGSVVKQGTGTLTLSNSNTYTGGTTVNAGTVSVENNSGLGTGNVVNRGTVLAGNGITVANHITVEPTTTAALIAGWDFQTTATGGTAATTSPGSPLVYNANFGAGTLYLNGTNGASTWTSLASNPEVTSFAGTALNAGPGFATSTTAPASLTIANSTANGKSMVFSVDMTGRTDLTVSYATQGTATGFNSQAWSWSTDGTTWSTPETITSIQSSYALGTGTTTTLTTITGLNNSSTAFVRLTVAGATNVSGNNRLDNIQFNVSVTGAPAILGSNVAGGSSTFSGAITLNGNVSLTAATGGTTTFTGSVSGGGTAIITGPGTVKAAPATANGFAPTQVDVTSGTLLLASSDVLGDTTALRMNGGTVALDNFSEGMEGTAGLGALILAANSTLDFGTIGGGANLLQFSSASFTAGSLSITDFDLGTDRLFITGSASAFTSAFPQSAISFNGLGGYSAISFGSYFEVVAIPEPATIFGGLALLGLVGFRERRRLHRLVCR